MKANLRLSLSLLLCALFSFTAYSQTTIGRMKVDQYPTSSFGTTTYGLTYLPADYDPAKKYPLIIFMHGSGEGGDGVAGLPNECAQGLPWWIARGFNPSAVNPVDGKTYEFIVVNPQAPSSWHWSYSYAQIQYILPDIISRYSIDQTRIYITGLSAGGAGTWSCVTNDATFARKIAAIMPNSDAGLNNTPVEGPHLKDITSTYGVPVWCVDGALDGLNGHTTVYLNTINAGPPAANPQAVQTLIPGAGHSAAAWDSAYSPTWRSNVFNMNAYEWMLQFQRLPAVLTASAGSNQIITLPVSSTTLNGTGTPSSGNSITSYAWTQLSGPTPATFGAATSASTGVSALVAGIYTFQLTVKDNTGASATSSMTVTVNPAVNVPPTVGAGSTQTITLPTSSVTLTGTATGNGGATISSTAWTETGGPNTATIAAATSLSTGVSGLIAGTYTFQLSATDNHSLTTTSSVTVIVKPANVPPTVGAGSTQTITLPTSSVTLTGTATGNGGATISSTSWTQTGGPNTATISAATSLSTGVSGLIAGTYTFQLSATDNNSLTSTSSVTVIVKPANVPPTVTAGSTQTITLPTSSVTLTGTATGNGGATISSTSWTQTGGPNTATIAAATSLSTGVSGLIAGTYTFQLSATDNNGLTSTSSVTVIVKPANVPPTVTAGSTQTITLPTSSVTLTGTATGNGGATISSTTWTETGGPNTATISAATSLSTGVSGLIAGTYTFQLSATDNNSLTSTSSVTVIVKPANVPPTVTAGSGQNITLPTSSVILTGTATGNGGATISSTTWTETGGPNTATISASTSLSTGVSGLIAGTYTFQLSATDNNSLSNNAMVTVIVNAAANVPPTVNAGSTQTITLPASSLTLTGTATGNGGATISSTAWTQTAGPNTATISAATSLSTGVSGLIAGTYTIQLSATDNNGVSATSSVTVIVKPANVPPTVNAGSTQTITLPTSSVNLTGTATGNGGATISSTAWTQTGGPNTATISAATSLSTGVSGLIAGTYTFQLSATDNNSLTSTSSVTVIVKPANVPPTVNAGSTQTITLPTSSVTLTGTATGNGGATISSTTWTETGGPNTATILTATSLSTGISGLIAGTYTFQLSATDNNSLTSTSSVTVIVNPANVPPTVYAGSTQTITLPTSSVTLTGTATGNGGATISSTTWTETGGPNTATITAATSLSTGVSGLIAGTYTFQLSATDNNSLTSTSSVTVIVKPANLPPTVTAGSTQTITLPTSSVTLTGTATGNGGATISSTTWTQTSGPNTATIAAATNLSTGVSGLIAGTYTFQLSATDNNSAIATSSVTVTVNAAAPAPPPPAPNQPPVANAGPPQTITLPTNSTSLDGSASYDPDGTITSYAWVQNAGSAGVTIANSNTAKPTVYGLQGGQYVFELTVTDNQGASANAQVTITINAATSTGPRVNTLIASAGRDTTIAIPATTALLNGSASTDAGGGGIVSYEWVQASGPAGAGIMTPDAAMATVDNLQLGTYTFRLKVTNARGDTAISTVKVSVISTLRPSSVNQLFLYPNPAHDMVHLRISGTGPGIADVNIYDVHGRLVARMTVSMQQGTSESALNVSGLGKGMYTLLVITSDGKVSRTKLMKQ